MPIAGKRWTAILLRTLNDISFYHGTSLGAAESIAQEGFRIWFKDDDIGRYAVGGNLGDGLYVTCNWRTALWFGDVLLRVAIRPATKLFNSALLPDEQVLEYLQREFGREILRKTPWKILPKNKKLTLRELIALFRYHYWHTWQKRYAIDRTGSRRWPRRRHMHSRLLDDFRKMLVRYGFHGFGNPEDDNGIVVFAEDRLLLKELVVAIPSARYSTLWEEDFRSFRDISELKELFQRQGSDRAKELARRISEADPTRPIV